MHDDCVCVCRGGGRRVAACEHERTLSLLCEQCGARRGAPGTRESVSASMWVSDAGKSAWVCVCVAPWRLEGGAAAVDTSNGCR